MKSAVEFAATRFAIGVLNILTIAGIKAVTGGVGEPLDLIVVGVALLPTAIFTVGATQEGIRRYGLPLVPITVGSWLLVGMTSVPWLGIYIFPAFGATLMMATQACRINRPDLVRASERPWWHTRGDG